MSEKLPTPVDALTGVPFPVLNSLSRISIASQNAHFHHSFPNGQPPAQKTLSQKALHSSRLQLLADTVHNEGSHSLHGLREDPPAPLEDKDRFRTIMFAAAHFIPERGINVWSDRESEPILPWQMDVLRAPDPKNPYSYLYLTYRHNPVRDFFEDYLPMQNLSHVDELKKEEFLITANDERQRYLGHYLLAQAAEVATELMEADYIALRMAGLLHPTTPNRPYTFARDMLGSQLRREQLFPRLKMNLGGLAIAA